jgi:chromosome segregation protein
MQLTTLEIKGFKSFADKTIIHFNNNITGIVGPNGCGKSNVVDSIRWVLGEQKTSQLRLEKMDNLIFNGTKNRKSSSLAEVSLTFENTKNLVSSDYKTITITRKLYRDGESEYRLNDVVCRLKDITSLFMDTGVSSDSYSIIELGMVDELLNDRDNSRRKLFEQAAGVSKYKKRKKETLDKLKNTDADLERVKDLLFEIEGNLKTLEKQASKTQKFYELKEEYKSLSLILARFALLEYKENFKTLDVKKQEEENNKLEVETTIKTTEAQLEKEKLDNVEKEKTLMEIQKKLNALMSGVSEKENERNLLNSQLKFSRDKMDGAEKLIIESKDQSEKLVLTLDKLKSDKETESAILDQKIAELSVLEIELNKIRGEHNAIKDSLSNEQKLYSEKEKTIFELEKKLAVNRNSNESLQRDLFQSEEETSLKRKELEGLNLLLEEMKLDKDNFDKKVSELQADEENRNTEIKQLEKSIEQLRADLTAETRTLDAKKNEYELTKSLVDNLEGFPESIKFLKKNNKWSKDAPLLSDVIYCAEEYRVAIENFLEPFLNYYIVQNMEEAIMAVNLLSDSSMGRANFFMLDAIRNRTKSPQKESINGLTPALSLIELDKEYAELGEYLLAGVYLVDESTTNFKELNLPQSENLVLLSKTGKLIRKDFSISGGAVGLFEGKKIGRAKNLEKLKTEIEKLEKSTYQLHTKVSDIQIKINQLKAGTKLKEIEETRTLLNQSSNKLSAAQASIQSLVNYLTSSDQKNKSITEKLDQLRTEVEQINKDLEVLKVEQIVKKEELEKTDRSFIALTNSLSEASSRFNQKNIEFHQQQNRVNSITQEFNFKTTQIESLDAQSKRNLDIIAECKLQIEDSSQKLKILESTLLEGYSGKENFEKEVADAEKSYYDSRKAINDLDANVREQSRLRDAVTNKLNAINEQSNELKLNLTSLRERLNVEFNINVNDIINDDLDPKWKKEEIEDSHLKIKKRVEGFGEINPMALEAYNEMKERFDFIVAQRKDLDDAKNSLLNTIQEIDDSARTQFMDSFTKVRESFINVFRTLFSEEDQCDLFLTNPEDPLESKIEIVAKPKGKRPTVIDQLSGGEKTLTATALLFSLYLLKPAPFCIFDEVDAPLDDTNIAKFNKIIHEFSRDSQFIIVTHNKQTMSSVEAIYGVTMVEQGVSKVVPVNFSSLN